MLYQAENTAGKSRVLQVLQELTFDSVAPLVNLLTPLPLVGTRTII